MKKLILFVLLIQNLLVFAQTKNIFVFNIDSEIDPRSNRLTKIALQEAENKNADLIIIKLNTYGGIIVDADSIRQMIINYPKPIVVFIDKNAASAGALISIAADSIYMSKGATIGAATAVHQDGEKASEKIQSYMKGMMRSSAETSGRDPHIAEAMVDESIAIDSVTKEGKLLTFTTSEAIKNNFCEAEVANIEGILAQHNISDYNITHFKIPFEESIIAWFLNPAISSVLIMIIVGGVYFEIKTPGVGFPILASTIAALLYFIPLYMNGLAENWEIALFFVGIILIILEVFVIPGFGVAGISGILITFLSIFLVLINNNFFDFTFVSSSEIFKSLIVMLFSMIATLGLMIFGGLSFAQSSLATKITLQDTLSNEEGYVSHASQSKLIGQKGVVFKDLRPSGKIKIDEIIYNAESRGKYLEEGTKVEIIKEDTNILIVKKA